MVTGTNRASFRPEKSSIKGPKVLRVDPPSQEDIQRMLLRGLRNRGVVLDLNTKGGRRELARR